MCFGVRGFFGEKSSALFLEFLLLIAKIYIIDLSVPYFLRYFKISFSI